MAQMAPSPRSPDCGATAVCVPLQPLGQALAHRGRYHTDRQPGAALQNTAICPAGAPGVRAASAGPQSHITHDTMILPGAHSCPLLQRSG